MPTDPSRSLEPAAAPLLPRMDPRQLRGFERLAVPLCAWINSTPRVKAAIQWYVRHVSQRWVAGITRARWRLYGLEHVRDLKPPGAVILVSNHRSFFDMYLGSAVLYEEASFLERLYFPVRSNFFYTNPVGLLVNLGVSGCAMWPPVFRDDRRTLLNPVGVEQMMWALERRGDVLGFHPEGTRGKGDDPYDMLPARPGLGRLLLSTPPDTLVVPFFILGPSNSVFTEIRELLRPTSDVRITFGAPVAAGNLARIGDAAAISDRVHAMVAALAEEDRRRTSG